MQIIVLGMHRSGTSVLTRLLNLAGAYFGPEGISTGANDENPKGFWERLDVRSLNDWVLHAVGCDWNRVSKLDVAALPPEIVAEFDKRASKLVLEIDAHRPWVLKEPRFCLLLPLWRKWFEMPICIHIYRNPVEVASSLHVRNGVPFDAGLALWERYVRSALAASAGLAQLVVSHRQIMEQPALAAAQLIKDLCAQGVRGLTQPTEREILTLVQPELYRQRELREDLRAFAEVAQVSLFQALQHGGLAPGNNSMSAQDVAALVRYEESLPALKPPSEKKMPDTKEVALQGEIALKEQEVQFLRQACGKHEADLKQRDERLAAMDRERSLAIESRQKLEALLGLREDRLTARDLEASLRNEQLAVMERESATLRDSVRILQADLTERIRQLQHSDNQLHAAERKIAAATEVALNLKGEIHERDARLAGFEREAASAQASIAAVRGENAKLTSELQDRDEELRKAAADGARSAEEARLAGLEILALEKRIEARHEELAKLGQLLMSRERDLATAKEELDRANCRLESQQQSAATAMLALEARLVNVTQSRTWRLMAPVRRLSSKLRPSAGRGDQLSRDRDALRKSDMFDETWYLQTYPDVANSNLGAVEHYLQFGATERRNPGPGFDTDAYLKNNPDVSDSGLNPLVHYITHGKIEGRHPK